MSSVPQPHFNRIPNALRRSISDCFLGLLGLLLLPAVGFSAATSPPLEHQAYVWQRAWTEPVRQAVSSRAGSFSRLVVLTAEIRWQKGMAQLTPVEVDYPRLAQAGVPIGLALRIGPFGGPFQPKGPEIDSLKNALREQIRKAEASGLHPAELQIDFDCASSKLSGYRVWIESLKQQFSPYPLTLTALPAWLGKSGFTELVQATDGFVLQVHSLDRPESFNAAFTLCDPTAALRAAEAAGRAKVPFRIALPTYGYLCAFDERGHFLGLSAEGPRPEWPAATRLKEVRSDEQAMSALVQTWSTNRPPSLKGIIWYRLPVEGDRLNWTWPTLRTVIAGSTLAPDIQAEATTEDSLLFEIDLLNRGTSDAIQPAQILVHWRGSRLVAADGLAGFTAEDKGPASLRFSLPTGSFRLEPGRRQRVGWVRFSKPTEVSIEVSSPAR